MRLYGNCQSLITVFNNDAPVSKLFSTLIITPQHPTECILLFSNVEFNLHFLDASFRLLKFYNLRFMIYQIFKLKNLLCGRYNKYLLHLVSKFIWMAQSLAFFNLNNLIAVRQCETCFALLGSIILHLIIQKLCY